MDESLINETNRKSRHPCWTPTARALWAAFALNTTFTCGQLVGALAANSIAMLGDTSTMFVDSVTYAAGLLGEYHKNQSGPRTAAAVELSAASFSVIALFGCTAYVTYDGITTIQDIQKNGDDGDGVNEKIMFGFTVGNLFLDVGMILSIYLRHRGGIIGCLLRCVRTREQLEHHASCDGHGRPESGLVDSKEDINLFAASAHVAADTMRTVTVLATAIAIWADPSNDGEMADACAGLVVSAIIFCIASFVAWETWTQARAELALRRAEREGAPPPALTGAKAVV